MLVISPHQDDETFGCGALIGWKREHGIPVTVLFLTNGQLCFGPNPPDPGGLEQTRQREAMAALGHLGVEPGTIHFFGLPDGSLSTLNEGERSSAVQSLADVIRACRPGEVYPPIIVTTTPTTKPPIF